MLKVILAEKDTIEKFHKYNLFLKPLLDNNELAFCAIDLDEPTIDKMVPDLHKVIGNTEFWEAVIIAPMDKNKLNPFDYVGYNEEIDLNRKNAVNWQLFMDYLINRQENYKKALGNPLMRLTYSLGLESAPVSVEDTEEHSLVINGDLPLCKLMVARRLKRMNVPKVVTWLKKYGNSALEKFFDSEESFLEVVDLVAKKDIDGIIEAVGEDNIPFFLSYIDEDDPYCSDPFYIVSQLDEISRTKQINEIKDRFQLFDTKPQDIVCISERCCDLPYMELNSKDNVSDFAHFNLYPSNTKFLLFDILPESHRQHEQDYIRFLTFILVVSVNGFPRGNVANGCLYKSDTVIDRNRFYEICSAFDARLAATRREIVRKINEESVVDEEPLDNLEVRKDFESDVHISVPETNEFDKSSLRAQYRDLGLSKDCPEDEEMKWVFQYREIEKNFLRFLREPRRSVKIAAKGEFQEKNRIVDWNN